MHGLMGSRDENRDEGHPNSSSWHGFGTLFSGFGAGSGSNLLDQVRGEARHLPQAMYVGGSVDKFDYVQPNECCLETLNMFCGEVAEENEESELRKSDYEGGEGYNEGANEPDVVDKVVHNEDNRDSSESSDEEEDDVDNEGDLDEAKDSDNGDGDGPNYPVFNLDETYDPTFELGMMFSNKDELKKAMHSHAIKSKRILKLKKMTKSGYQAYRAKRAALKALEGSSEFQYTRLWDYADEIRKTTPSSTVIVGTEQTDGDERFSRFYFCFGAMKDGFKAGCRPIIGIDGCHLKGPQGLDDNVQTLPVVNEPNEGRMRKRKMTHPSALRRSNRLQSGIEPQHPNILPPAQVDNEEDATPKGGITQEEIPPPVVAPQRYKTGPSMFQQLAMSNAHLTLQPRMQIRAPPPMISHQGLPIFSSTNRVKTTVVNPIIREGGQKYLDLN
ncbi:UNVERIFIED_CONTAM: hypothetical protein Scaly_3032300 [Sesamum calycinum]|uniref:Uncharacterized protein n=1 Tax=Sesamum calycinum TaxID=2727403 RepID=A0AAW2K7N9_9LAMI